MYGKPAQMSTLDLRRPMSVLPWTLWCQDTFDRESPPTLEAAGERFTDGLVALWRHTLIEGIDEAGNATFSSFVLTWGEAWAERADAAVQPFGNRVHARLRAWVGGTVAARVLTTTGEAVLRQLALRHYHLLQYSPRWRASAVAIGEEASQLLAAIAETTDLDAFLREAYP